MYLHQLQNNHQQSTDRATGVSKQHCDVSYIREINTTNAVLSISFEVDVPTGKVGGSLLFKRRRRELLRGVWGNAPNPPRKF